MRIVFMGTPEFSVPSLRILVESRHTVVTVVTVPDKPQGRGLGIRSSAVKSFAMGCGIPVLQPEDLSDEGFLHSLISVNADLFVVVAFRILPEQVFTIPPLGTFNLHASLLPKYRGASPINWALINGEKKTGVTSFFIRRKVDTGNILLQEEMEVDDQMTAGDLHDRLSEIGAHVVLRTVDGIESGSLHPHMQDDAEATSAPKIFRETCRIQWGRTAREVHNHIRGLSPAPAAWTTFDGRQVKVFRSRALPEHSTNGPGIIMASSPQLLIGCGEGAIEILELQMEGRKLLSADEFVRGYHLPPGQTFV